MKTPQQELTRELLDHLYRTMADKPSAEVQWVMNAEWLAEVLLIEPWSPPPAAGPLLLLGMPVDVRDDGGAPHLEPAP